MIVLDANVRAKPAGLRAKRPPNGALGRMSLKGGGRRHRLRAEPWTLTVVIGAGKVTHTITRLTGRGRGQSDWGTPSGGRMWWALKGSRRTYF